jgi:hypothetical protein
MKSMPYKKLSMMKMMWNTMPRQKKDGRYLNLYLNRALHEEFEQFCETLGQTKTVASERALRMYMDTMKQNPEQIMREGRK